jgi:formate dehydrogenase subunit gamma
MAGTRPGLMTEKPRTTYEEMKSSKGQDAMAKLFAQIRFIAAAVALAFMVATVAPVSAQQPNSVNPTASSVQEQQLLKELSKIEGRGTIPDVRSYVIEHPAGRDWRQYHTVTLKWIGAIAILGAILLLVIFYLVRGSVRIESGRSGIKIVRFTAFERFVHWLTAACFIVQAVSGLNITFGRALLLPLLGPEAFTTFSEMAKYAHNFLSFPFTLGVIVIFFMWIAGNIPNKVDVEWAKRGGGIVGHDHPPAYRFNAGQKAIFWVQMLGGTAMVVSGYLLIFPFYGTTVADMQLAEIAHATLAMLYIAAMIGHIYIGSLGMEGAFEAMSQGTVDLNWAKEHHSLWLTEEGASIGANESTTQAQGRAAATPAE